MFPGRRVRALQREVNILQKYKVAMNAENGGLRRSLAKAEAALKLAEQERADWSARAERFGDDRIRDARQHMETRLAAAGLSLQVDDLTAVCARQAGRLGRAVRACARYRAENSELRTENALLADEAKRANDRAEMFGADRAVLLAVPTPEVERLRRKVRDLEALALRQEDQLAAYRDQDEARDRARLGVAA